MERPPHDALTAEIHAALDWWREAGVDCAFHDAALPWLAPPAAEAAPVAPNEAQASVAAPPPAPKFGGDPAQWPREVAAFAAWWLSEPTLDDGPLALRVPPRGQPGAALMVLVPEPEPGDRERLLAGRQGKLLAAFLAAAGIGEDQLYVASVLPRPTPMPDWGALHAAGIGAVLRHHIGLVAPQRLVAFGRHIPSLIDHTSTQTSPASSIINHESGSTALLAARELGALLDRPALKAGFWQSWLAFAAG